MSDKRMIVVLGMHRSGTSALARGLQVLSVELGDNLMPPSEVVNPKGFWEDLDIFAINEKLLAKLGSAWFKIGPLQTERLAGPEFSEDRQAASALLKRKLAQAELFAFKDPRASVLLPFWQCVFSDMGISAHYVIAVRNPLEVAASLRKRDDFEPVYSVALWAKHMQSILMTTVNCPRLFVAFEALVEAPREQLQRLAGFLGLSMPSANSKKYQEYASEFLDPGMKHFAVSENELGRSGVVPESVQKLYSRLLTLCAEEETSGDDQVGLVDEVGRFSCDIRPYALYIDQLLDEKASQSAKIGSLQSDLAGLGEVLAAEQLTHEQRQGLLEAELSQAAAQIDNLLGERDELQSQQSASAERESALQSEAGEAIERLRELSGRIDHLESERLLLVQEHEAHMLDRSAELRAAQERFQDSQVQLATLLETVSLLEAKIADHEEREALAQAQLEAAAEREGELARAVEAQEQAKLAVEREYDAVLAEQASALQSAQHGLDDALHRIVELGAVREDLVVKLKAGAERETLLRMQLEELADRAVVAEDKSKQQEDELWALNEKLAEMSVREAELESELSSLSKALEEESSRLEKTETRCAALDNEIETLKDRIEFYRQANTGLEKEISVAGQYRHRSEGLEQELVQARTQLRRTEFELGKRDDDLRSLGTQMADRQHVEAALKHELEVLSRHMAQSREEASALRGEMLALQEHAKALQVDLRLTKVENRDMKASSSWYLTRPIRWLGRLVQRVRG